jgi:hypothetical protein
VDGGIETGRPFKLDQAAMKLLDQAGVLKTVCARLDGRLVGYYTWNIQRDVESEGMLIAQQGAWYVEPGHRKLAFLMFARAKSELKALGVEYIYPHHRTMGRGCNLGRFFERQGAVRIQETYSLRIGGVDA